MGTICSPKQPIHLQYDHVARMLGIAVDPLLIRSSFKRCELARLGFGADLSSPY